MDIQFRETLGSPPGQGHEGNGILDLQGLLDKDGHLEQCFVDMTYMLIEIAFAIGIIEYLNMVFLLLIEQKASVWDIMESVCLCLGVSGWSCMVSGCVGMVS